MRSVLQWILPHAHKFHSMATTLPSVCLCVCVCVCMCVRVLVCARTDTFVWDRKNRPPPHHRVGGDRERERERERERDRDRNMHNSQHAHSSISTSNISRSTPAALHAFPALLDSYCTFFWRHSPATTCQRVLQQLVNVFGCTFAQRPDSFVGGLHARSRSSCGTVPLTGLQCLMPTAAERIRNAVCAQQWQVLLTHRNQPSPKNLFCFLCACVRVSVFFSTKDVQGCPAAPEEFLLSHRFAALL